MALKYFAFSIVLISLIVLIELIIKFKRPFILKAILCLIVICIGWRAGAYIYIQHYGYNRWLIEMTSSIMLAASLSFFSLIYQNKTKFYIIAFGLLTVMIQFGVISYYSFVIKVDNNIHLKDLNIDGYFINFLKIGFGTITVLINGWFVYYIYVKFQPKNIYYSKLRIWSLINLSLLLYLCVNNFYKNSKPAFNNLSEFFLLLGHFTILLTFLFRPSFLNRIDIQVSFKSLFTSKSTSKYFESLFFDTFFTKLYFLNNEASVEDLKGKFDLTSEELSNYVYTNYGLSTTDFINKHRIVYFIDLINSRKFKEYTIDALALESGFSSRFHLYKSFKKFHGGTPSNYIKSVSN